MASNRNSTTNLEKTISTKTNREALQRNGLKNKGKKDYLLQIGISKKIHRIYTDQDK